MTTEEKAQAYDEAIKRAEAVIKVAQNQKEVYGCITTIFPELCESDDEKIRKHLISLVKNWDKDGIASKYTSDVNDIKQILAWLEKQGEPVEINPTEFDTRLQTLIGKFSSLPKEELIGSLSFWLNVVQNDGTYKDEEKQGKTALEAVNEEKVDKQNCVKPTGKVEPKFHKGEWIACEELNTALIINIYDDKYEVEFIDGSKGFPHIDYIDRNFHLWAIQDAKDGDVLWHSDSASNGIFIFKEIRHDGKVLCYCDYDSEDYFCTGEHHTCCWSNAKYIKPTTKTQRNLLFAKMKEAGYEWDAEKKELKKIAEDLTEFENTLADVCRGWIGEEPGWKDYIIKNSFPLLELAKKQFNEYEPAEWSKEDEEKFRDVIRLIEQGAPVQSIKDHYTNWLKSLKPQLKQEWSDKKDEHEKLKNSSEEITKNKENAKDFLESSGIMDKDGKLAQQYRLNEEDEVYYNDICEILTNLLCSKKDNINKNAVQKDINWLQSIKSRSKQEYNEETELLKVKGFLVRDKDDYTAIYAEKPHRGKTEWVDGHRSCLMTINDAKLVPDIEFEDEPVEVEVTLKRV